MTTTHVEQLSCFERIGKFILDDLVAPIFPVVPDLKCFEPSPTCRHALVLEVPGVTQVNTYSCGATASWSVITAMGWRVSFSRWLKICHNAGMSDSLGADGGMDEHELDAALRRVGARLRTRKFRNRDQIQRIIGSGSPVLFGWDDDGHGNGDHWLYAYGFTKSRVMIGNIVRPGFSKGVVSWGEWVGRLTPREIYTVEEA